MSLPLVRLAEHQAGIGAAGSFRYLPGWILGQKADGPCEAVNRVLWDDVEANMDLLLQLGTGPSLTADRIRRLSYLDKERHALQRLRRRELRES